jgi:hypothetical protein
MISWFLAFVLGAATTGGATASMMSEVGGAIPRLAIAPGFLTVWFGPPLTEKAENVERAEYAVFFAVNTTVWAFGWKCCPYFARQASMAIAMDAAAGFGARFVTKPAAQPK